MALVEVLTQLVTPAQLQHAHSKDISRGLLWAQVHEIEDLAVSCARLAVQDQTQRFFTA